MSQDRKIVGAGGHDPARLFRGLELHRRIDAAIKPGEATLQQPLSPLEVERFEKFSSRYAEIHHPIHA